MSGSALRALASAVIALIAGAVLAPATLRADAMVSTVRSARPAERSAFVFGTTGQRQSLKAGDGNELIGNSLAVQLGIGHLGDNWYGIGCLDIILGPNEPVHKRQLQVDYSGTGFTGWVGFSAQTLNLRSPEGGYGFALGLDYADVVGRAIGRSRGGDEGQRLDDYQMRVNSLTIMPGVFFSWLDPARPRGNTPELLATRVEGYVLTIGASMPLVANYQARYERRSRRDVRKSQVTEAEEPPAESVSESGQLRGYGVLISLLAFLST